MMQETMGDRSNQESCDSDEREPAVKCVERCEKFTGFGMQRVDGAHPAKDHRGVEQRIEPGEALKEVIAANAEEQRSRHDRESC